MYSIQCPVCFQNVPTDRFVDGTAYCTCGHSYTVREPKGTHDKSIAIRLIILTLLFAAVVVHIFNWDTYSIAIIMPKMKQMTGTASVQDLNVIADICQKRKKENCEIHALLKSFDLDHTQSKNLVRTGEILMEKKRFSEAVKVYATYFAGGGKDDDVRYNYALALNETGRLQEAREEFAYLIHGSGPSPKFNVARSYVELLMKINAYSEAREVIAEYRQTGPTASLFLDKEWRKINSIVNLDARSRLPAAATRASISQ
jgi:tetratricopeptide (TPR) repeat protein